MTLLLLFDIRKKRLRFPLCHTNFTQPRLTTRNPRMYKHQTSVHSVLIWDCDSTVPNHHFSLSCLCQILVLVNEPRLQLYETMGFSFPLELVLSIFIQVDNGQFKNRVFVYSLLCYTEICCTYFLISVWCDIQIHEF